MRTKTASPAPLLALAVALSLCTTCSLSPASWAQEPESDPHVCLAPGEEEALAEAEAPGEPEPPDEAAEAPAEALPPPVRLADVGQGSLLLKTVHPGVYVPAPLLETDVAISVSGLVARTRVTQRFQNPTALWVEGVYAFPLPENAAVDTLTMVVGDRVIEGQIREREQARREYEQAKSEGKKASLLEQQRPNLFTTALANLGPDEVAEVRIEYQQELRSSGGKLALRFPMVATERYQPGGRPPEVRTVGGMVLAAHRFATDEDAAPAAAVARPAAAPVREPARTSAGINPVRLTVDLDPGFPLARLESATHPIRTRPLGRLRHAVALDAETVPADRDFVLEWTPARGAAPRATLLTEEIDGDTYALLMVMPPAETAGARFDVPREVVYVIDSSGSMGGASIRQAQAALDLALARLEPRDTFNVIDFDSGTRRLFPESVPATPDNVAAARSWVAGLEADGGTEMLGALEAALDGQAPPAQAGLRQVVFVTDGAVGNEEQLFAHIHAHLGDSRLFTVGIGSAPNSHFMTRAAEFGRGTFTFIGAPEEVQEKMGALFRQLDRPALTDVEVAWGDPGAETYPARIPDLYSGEPVVVASRMIVPPGGQVRLSGATGGTPWEVVVEAVETSERAGIDKLWARRKIAALSGKMTLGGELDALRAAIVDLGLTYHLVTEFTSLVAVDTTLTAPVGERPRTTLIPVNVPAGWEGGFQHVLPQGGTAAWLNLLIGLVLLAAGALAALRLRAQRAESWS